METQEYRRYVSQDGRHVVMVNYRGRELTKVENGRVTHYSPDAKPSEFFGMTWPYLANYTETFRTVRYI